MAFLEPKEAEKFEKQKWIQYCGTPCINYELQNEEIEHSSREKRRGVGDYYLENLFVSIKNI